MRFVLAIASVVFAALFTGQVAVAQTPQLQPIIDMHRHTPWPGDSDTEGLEIIRKELSEQNVVAASLFITGREDISHYDDVAGIRFLLSPMFPCPPLTANRKWCFIESETGMPDLRWLEGKLASQKLGGLGELAFNYADVAPGDPKMAPYWALAAEFDVPAFVHSGRGPPEGRGPRRHKGCCPDYDPELGNPALLRPVLQKYPNLRLVLQHVGFDFMDETIALMSDYPRVYVDMSVVNSAGPLEVHDGALRRLIDAGMASRVLFGSDDQDIAVIRQRIEGAEYLTPEQRRGIYYDNAARFLRLTPGQIASDHAIRTTR